TVADSALPRIALGRRRVTRLIAGYNPVGGFSHATPTLSNYMRSYFTVERTLEFLQHCEALGINTFQFDLSGKTRQVLDRLWAADSDLQFICLHSERAKDASLEDVMNYKAIAVVHHGGVTDSLFRDGKAQQVHDFVKKVHDRGALAGVSTHNPANVARMADEGWENDLFMTCFYNVARTRDEMKQELGLATVGEPFIDTDPDKMTAVIRQVDKPCLAFKILAAGRRCANQKSVSDAFQYAFHNIKTTDAVIVGMFPVDKDEVAENVQLAKQFGAA
ncbi:MAG: hypothetical protein NTW86_16575, partial [Candidatus Sumerlaeota bacterium]|nr:hypothetical protein [Candidatus Sumerlaeota bacterium]